MGTYAAELRDYGPDGSYSLRVIVYDAVDDLHARRIPMALFISERSRDNEYLTKPYHLEVNDIVELGFSKRAVGGLLNASSEKDPEKRAKKVKAMLDRANVRSLDECLFPK